MATTVRSFQTNDYQTVALLRAGNLKPQTGDKAYVAALNVHFDWDASSVVADDGVKVIKQTSEATGRWVATEALIVPNKAGNFGQLSAHTTYTDFNTKPVSWGYTYVQGNTNGPNTSSAQYYRSRLTLGSEYQGGIVGGAGQEYWLELAVPRTPQPTEGLWARRNENGTVSGWQLLGGTAHTGTTPTAYSNVGAQTGFYYGTNDAQPLRVYTNASHATDKAFMELSSVTGLTTAAVTAPVPVFTIGRNGKSSVTYPATLGVSLGKWNAAIGAGTRADVRVGNGSTNVPDTAVMTLLSDNRAGIGQFGTGEPQAGWHIITNGTASLGFTANGQASTRPQAAFLVTDSNWSADVTLATTVPGSSTGALTRRWRVNNVGAHSYGTADNYGTVGQVLTSRGTTDTPTWGNSPMLVSGALCAFSGGEATLVTRVTLPAGRTGLLTIANSQKWCGGGVGQMAMHIGRSNIRMLFNAGQNVTGDGTGTVVIGDSGCGAANTFTITVANGVVQARNNGATGTWWGAANNGTPIQFSCIY